MQVFALVGVFSATCIYSRFHASSCKRKVYLHMKVFACIVKTDTCKHTYVALINCVCILIIIVPNLYLLLTYFNFLCPHKYYYLKSIKFTTCILYIVHVYSVYNETSILCDYSIILLL